MKFLFLQSWSEFLPSFFSAGFYTQVGETHKNKHATDLMTPVTATSQILTLWWVDQLWAFESLFDSQKWDIKMNIDKEKDWI